MQGIHLRFHGLPCLLYMWVGESRVAVFARSDSPMGTQIAAEDPEMRWIAVATLSHCDRHRDAFDTIDCRTLLFVIRAIRRHLLFRRENIISAWSPWSPRLSILPSMQR